MVTNMVEEIATVVSSEEKGVWLSTQPVSSCHACHSSENCGTGAVAKAFTPRTHHFFVNTELSLLPGEQVRISITENSLLKAAFMVYLLPLCLLVFSVLLVQTLLQPQEAILILTAIIATVAGFMLARSYNQRFGQTQEHVHIVEVVPSLGTVYLS